MSGESSYNLLVEYKSDEKGELGDFQEFCNSIAHDLVAPDLVNGAVETSMPSSSCGFLNQDDFELPSSAMQIKSSLSANANQTDFNVRNRAARVTSALDGSGSERTSECNERATGDTNSTTNAYSAPRAPGPIATTTSNASTTAGTPVKRIKLSHKTTSFSRGDALEGSRPGSASTDMKHGSDIHSAANPSVSLSHTAHNISTASSKNSDWGCRSSKSNNSPRGDGTGVPRPLPKVREDDVRLQFALLLINAMNGFDRADFASKMKEWCTGDCIMTVEWVGDIGNPCGPRTRLLQGAESVLNLLEAIYNRAIPDAVMKHCSSKLTILPGGRSFLSSSYTLDGTQMYRIQSHQYKNQPHQYQQPHQYPQPYQYQQQPYLHPYQYQQQSYQHYRQQHDAMQEDQYGITRASAMPPTHSPHLLSSAQMDFCARAMPDNSLLTSTSRPEVAGFDICPDSIPRSGFSDCASSATGTLGALGAIGAGGKGGIFVAPGGPAIGAGGKGGIFVAPGGPSLFSIGDDGELKHSDSGLTSRESSWSVGGESAGSVTSRAGSGSSGCTTSSFDTNEPLPSMVYMMIVGKMICHITPEKKIWRLDYVNEVISVGKVACPAKMVVYC